MATNQNWKIAINELYNKVVRGIEYDATHSDHRAYGGILRAEKGKLVENIANIFVIASWTELLKQPINRLETNSKKYLLTIPECYLSNKTALAETIKNYKESHRGYKFSTDVQVFIDGKLVLPIECKTYTENAMLKRILVDAQICKKLHGTEDYLLLQLESQLGGDFSHIKEQPVGSPSTNALLALFPDINLHICTLISGERNIEQPIHKEEFYKELSDNALDFTMNKITSILTKFV